ncbi:probable LRR receptor-like serine/threonine-protein kinase At1g34110 [Prunus avium]|uniref:Probable LRR receptor-like serine/threonine-protein kinase At1g34110 n=1 Tax=Prunus avium TaxID=42229 RepID=A0A6P5RDU4_PRUAV|nr:probable LRR receptor-like serine/threonine-protein kinase At1g34110 [Prunus avium]
MAIVDLRRCFKLWYSFVVPLLHMSPSINVYIERERQALLAFKQGLVVDTRGQIVSTWGTSEGQNKDCCTWKGVYCSNQTGQVVELQLGSQSLQVLNLTDNQLEGDITNSFSELCSLRSLGLSNNNLSGEFPKFVQVLSKCSQKQLEGLYLSNNRVSGKIPESIGQISSLTELSLYGNQLSGRIPASIGQMQLLTRLSLYGNRLSGRIPESIGQMSNLVYINLENQLSGLIPGWLGFELPKLVILILRSNRFYGRIPLQLCNLTHVQILDLSINNISGTIPKCLSNLTALVDKGHSILTITHHYACNFGNGIFSESYDDVATLVWKGIMSEYKSTLGLVKSFHLSSNQLTGEIPKEIIHLGGLVSLNLSRNHLTGQINPDIGKLELLQSLDLSRNQIDGRIPTSLFQIYGLGDLDLSNNNLSGNIPMGSQLQNFDPSAFAENPLLCGLPLQRMCDQEK